MCTEADKCRPGESLVRLRTCVVGAIKLAELHPENTPEYASAVLGDGEKLLSLLVKISRCFQDGVTNCPKGYKPRRIVSGFAGLNGLWPTCSDRKLMEAAVLLEEQAQNLLSQLQRTPPLQTGEMAELFFQIEQVTQPVDLLANPFSSLLRAPATAGHTLKKTLPEFTAKLTQN